MTLPDGSVGVRWVEGGEALHACSTGSTGLLALRLADAVEADAVERAALLALAAGCMTFLEGLLDLDGLVADHAAGRQCRPRGLHLQPGAAHRGAGWLRSRRGGAHARAARAGRLRPGRLWAHAPAFNAILVRELLRLDALHTARGSRAWAGRTSNARGRRRGIRRRAAHDRRDRPVRRRRVLDQRRSPARWRCWRISSREPPGPDAGYPSMCPSSRVDRPTTRQPTTSWRGSTPTAPDGAGARRSRGRWIWRVTTQPQRDAALTEQTGCGTDGPTLGRTATSTSQPAGCVRGRCQRGALFEQLSTTPTHPALRTSAPVYSSMRSAPFGRDAPGAVAGPSHLREPPIVEEGDRWALRCSTAYPTSRSTADRHPGRGLGGLEQGSSTTDYELVASPTLRRTGRCLATGRSAVTSCASGECVRPRAARCGGARSRVRRAGRGAPARPAGARGRRTRATPRPPGRRRPGEHRHRRRTG